MKEIFKDVVGYNGKYQVSNKGRVKSFSRKSPKGKIMKLEIHEKGYTVVRLSDHNFKLLHTFVHRLIAQVFIPNPLNKPQINHIDGNPKNNKIENLEWCTHRENMQHKKLMGRCNPVKGEDSNFCKLKTQDVIKIRERSEAGEMRKTIAKDYNITPEGISLIVLRKTWKHI